MSKFTYELKTKTTHKQHKKQYARFFKNQIDPGLDHKVKIRLQAKVTKLRPKKGNKK